MPDPATSHVQSAGDGRAPIMRRWPSCSRTRLSRWNSARSSNAPCPRNPRAPAHRSRARRQIGQSGARAPTDTRAPDVAPRSRQGDSCRCPRGPTMASVASRPVRPAIDHGTAPPRSADPAENPRATAFGMIERERKLPRRRPPSSSAGRPCNRGSRDIAAAGSGPARRSRPRPAPRPASPTKPNRYAERDQREHQPDRMQADFLADQEGLQDVALDELARPGRSRPRAAGMCQSGQNCAVATPTASRKPVSVPI